jgi:3',5'-cyclic AMP phosphodiesterase CpdA
MARGKLRPEVQMITILHGSDLHFGKAFDPEVAEVFRNTVREATPDLLVLSGDFTQRAKVREYRQAQEYLASLPDIPLVVTPGNHDVPLYRAWERLFTPLRNYREYISHELDTVTTIGGAVVVSLDTTAPHRAIVNGHLRDRQLLFAAEAFRGAPPEAVKILVGHHHLAPAPDYESDQVLSGYQRCLDAFEGMGVDLILGGHLHRSYVADSRDIRPENPGWRGIVIAHTGTTTSRRGRARERNKNSLNLIGIFGDRIEITHHLYHPESSSFLPSASHTFPRKPLGFLTGGAGVRLGEPGNGARKELAE